jgi:hypothetical protein
MIKFSQDWIRPFQISTPNLKGGEQQPYLHGCYRDMASSAYELLFPGEEWNPTEIFPGIYELNIKAELLTPDDTNLVLVTHPLAITGQAPVVMPTGFQTDWWIGGLRLWFAKTDLKVKKHDPIAMLLVVKRTAVVRPMNNEDQSKVNVFNEYISNNAEELKTRPDNIYERMSWLVESGKIVFRPKKKYKIL